MAEYGEQLRKQQLKAERVELEREMEEHKSFVADRDRALSTADSRWRELWNVEAVAHLAEMMQCQSRTVREKAAGSIALLCECSRDNQRLFTERSRTAEREVKGIAPSIVGLLKVGALGAIGTVEKLTLDNREACDIMRDTGAINLLAGFINSDSSEPPPGMPGTEYEERVLSEPAQKWGLGLDEANQAARPAPVPPLEPAG